MMLGIDSGSGTNDDYGAKPSMHDLEAPHSSAPIRRHRARHGLLTLVERALFTLCSVTVSIFLPDFSSMMAFLGAFTSFLLCIIGPVSAKAALTGRCTFWDGCLIAGGVVMATWGTIASFWSMQ